MTVRPWTASFHWWPPSFTASRIDSCEREPTGHTLQTTALVNEAYLRLIDASQVAWQDRAHFFAVSAKVMRRILVDFARARGYQKRGGDAVTIRLDEAMVPVPPPSVDVIALDEALERLSAFDPRAAQDHRAAVLRRPHRRGDGRGDWRVGPNDQARVGDGEGLAVRRAVALRADMDPDRWARAKEIFRAAHECDAGGRDAYLREACAGDLPLREAVETMLADEAGAAGFLEAPALEVEAMAIARVMAEDRPSGRSATVSGIPAESAPANPPPRSRHLRHGAG